MIMDMKTLGIALILLCVFFFLFSEFEKRATFRKLHNLLARGEYGEYLSLLDSFLVKYLYPKYNRLYMKLNGYWRNAEDSLSGRWETFGFHAGIGQTWQGGTAVAFHQNYRRLIDTVRIFLTGGEIRELTLDMDVAEWFCNPHVWDFNYFGGAVMQDQEAQQAIRDNASGVFSIQ